MDYTPEQQQAIAMAQARKRQSEAQTQKPMMSRVADKVAEQAKGGWEGVKEGITFGFGDELQAATAAGSIGAQNLAGFNTGGLTMGDTYDQALSQLRQEKTQQQEAAPLASLAGNITGGALATRGISAPQTVGMAAKQGGALGALYGFGSGEGGFGNRALNAGLYGAGGAALGAGVKAALEGVKQLPKAIDAIKYKSIIPNSDQVKELATKSYQEAAQKGGTLTPQFADDFIVELQKMQPQTMQGKALSGGDSPVTKVIQRLSGTVDNNGVVQGGITGKPITLDAAQEMDEVLSDMIDGYVQDGKLSKEGMKMLDIQTKFRDMINTVDQSKIVGGKEGFDALKNARKLWSTSRQMADIERIINRAYNMEQPATGIKSGFRTMLANPARMRSYSPDVKKAIENAANTGVVTDIIRTAGSRLLPLISLGSGGGVMQTAAATAGSSIARDAASRVQMSKAAKIGEAIANNAGLIKKVKRF